MYLYYQVKSTNWLWSNVHWTKGPRFYGSFINSKFHLAQSHSLRKSPTVQNPVSAVFVHKLPSCLFHIKWKQPLAKQGRTGLIVRLRMLVASEIDDKPSKSQMCTRAEILLIRRSYTIKRQPETNKIWNLTVKQATQDSDFYPKCKTKYRWNRRRRGRNGQ